MACSLNPGMYFARRHFEVANRLRDEARAVRARARSLSGRWQKDFDASESMTRTEDLFNLTLIARRGARLVSNLVIEDTDEIFQTKVKALVLSVNETYLKTGEPAKYPRRDLRRGQIEGRFSVSKEGHPVVTASWKDPYQGYSEDTYEMSPDGESITQTSVFVRDDNGQKEVFKTIWRKKA